MEERIKGTGLLTAQVLVVAFLVALEITGDSVGHMVRNQPTPTVIAFGLTAGSIALAAIALILGDGKKEATPLAITSAVLLLGALVSISFAGVSSYRERESPEVGAAVTLDEDNRRVLGVGLTAVGLRSEDQVRLEVERLKRSPDGTFLRLNQPLYRGRFGPDLNGKITQEAKILLVEQAPYGYVGVRAWVPTLQDSGSDICYNGGSHPLTSCAVLRVPVVAGDSAR